MSDILIGDDKRLDHSAEGVDNITSDINARNSNDERDSSIIVGG